MCYNMEPYQDPWTTSAVATMDRFKQYVTAAVAEAYPVMLDIAYPIFRQSVYMSGNNAHWPSTRIIYTTIPVGYVCFLQTPR